MADQTNRTPGTSFDTGQSYGGDGTSDSGSMRDQAREGADRVREQAGEYASQAQERMTSGADTAKERAAGGLGNVATKMRERAETDSGTQAKVEARAAEAMESASNYLREHDTQELLNDIEAYMKAHPIQAAAGALFAGYVLGKVIR